MSAAGKGFSNKPVSNSNNLLPLTRPSESRRVDGTFAKLLSQTSKVFEDLKNVEGVSRDVYVRLSKTETCYFVGKINYKSGLNIAPDDAALYYATLIQEYAKALRPKDLAGPGKGRDTVLEIWTAAGNTEMDVAKNTVSLELLVTPSLDELPPLLEISQNIGYEPEIYQNNEQGFRVKRDAGGHPIGTAFEVKMANPSELEVLKDQGKL